jgi:hypothetical protein
LVEEKKAVKSSNLVQLSKSMNVGFIVMNHVVFTPIEYNIRPLIIESVAKPFIQPDTYGPTEKMVARFKTIHDFPRQKKNQLSKEQVKLNEALAERYNKDGKFPFTVLVNEKGVVLKTWDGFTTARSVTPTLQKEYNYNFKPEETSLVRMRRNDWVRGKNEISRTYIEMLRNATSHITIFCSYFIPGKIIRKLLQRAAKKGVKISVVTAGPSDVMLAKYAERWMYDWLLRNNIELYEYQTTVLHAKIAVCDSEWLTIGSYNINNISAYASIELNLDVKNVKFATATESLLEDIIQHQCIAITKETHRFSKNIFKQFMQWCSYQFIRVAFYLITFYYKQKG